MGANLHDADNSNNVQSITECSVASPSTMAETTSLEVDALLDTWYGASLKCSRCWYSGFPPRWVYTRATPAIGRDRTGMINSRINEDNDGVDPNQKDRHAWKEVISNIFVKKSAGFSFDPNLVYLISPRARHSRHLKSRLSTCFKLRPGEEPCTVSNAALQSTPVSVG